MINKIELFDEQFYIEINHARWSMAEGVLDRLSGIRRCFDVGCGPGWFAERLVKRGLVVIGFDGRNKLLEEARLRTPGADFCVLDIMHPEAHFPGKAADLVFCFGLLYHLENPFAAIRNLYRMTGHYLFIETKIAPGKDNHLVIISEGQNHTQGLSFHAIIPSRNALLKMLYVAGFSSVYRYTGSIPHEDFIDSEEYLHRREIFMATKNIEFSLPDFVFEAEPTTSKISYLR